MIDSRSNDESWPGTEEAVDRLSGNAAFCRLLIELDEAIYSGRELGTTADTQAKLSDESRAALRDAQHCLELLNRVAQGELLLPSAIATDVDVPQDSPACGQRDRNVDRHRTVAARPERIGRFLLIEQLGAGGFGIVYLASDPRTQRLVALKIPRIEALSSVELQKRFEQEAKAAAKLDHPNIVPVLEAGTDGMLPYIVSLYYPGPTLSSWLTQHANFASPREAAELIRSLAEGLAHAHERGVLHRDIKPSNILLTGGGVGAETAPLTGFVPKLMGFGLAKLADSAGDMTHSGALLGTVRYMPPEQAAGQTRLIGATADIYSLGAVFYELLTGKPPFAGDSDLEVLRRIATDEPGRPRAGRRDVPRDLETICLKCLEKDPAKRYPTAQGLALDLDRFLSGRPIVARAASPPERVWKWCRRNPQVTGFLAVSFTALIAFIAFLLHSNARISAALEAQRISQVRLQEQVYASDMRLAGEAMILHNPDRALELLQPYRAGAAANLREFAWHFLWNQLHQPGRRLAKLNADAFGLACSPDGELVVAVSRKGTAHVFQIADGRELAVLATGSAEATEAAFSPDGQWLATAAGKGELSLWRTDSWTRERSCEKLGDLIGCVMFTSDSKSLVACSGPQIGIWEVASGRISATGQTPRGDIYQLELSPDDKRLVGSTRGKCYLWETERLQADPQELKTRDTHRIFSTTFLPSDTSIVLGYQHAAIRIVDQANSGLVKNIETAQSAPIVKLVCSPNGRWLAAVAHNTLEVFSAPGFKRSLLVRNPGGRIWDAEFVPQQDAIVIGDVEGNVLLYDLRATDLSVRPDGGYEIHQFGAGTSCLALSADGRLAACGLANGEVRVVDTDTGAIVEQIVFENSPVVLLKFLGDGHRLLCGQTDGRLGKVGLFLVELSTGQILQKSTLAGRTDGIAASPDVQRLALARQDEQAVVIVNWSNGQEELRINNVAGVQCLSFSPNGKLLVAACTSRLAMFDTQTGKCLSDQGHYGHDFLEVRWLKGGQQIFVAEGDYGAAIRTVPSGSVVSRLVAHSKPVRAVAGDGRNLATFGDDNTLRIWDSEMLQPVLVLPDLQPARCRGLHFTRHGKTLIALVRNGEDDDHLLRWSIRP